MVSLIDNNQLDYFIKNNSSWIIYNRSIKKEFKFNDFVEAFGFMTKVAMAADRTTLIDARVDPRPYQDSFASTIGILED